MKIGIGAGIYNKSGYSRWGEDAYKKLRSHGFDCADYDMSDTDSDIYVAGK